MQELAVNGRMAARPTLTFWLGAVLELFALYRSNGKPGSKEKS